MTKTLGLTRGLPWAVRRGPTRRGAALLVTAVLFCGSGCASSPPDFEPILRAEDARQVDAPALTEAVAASDARLRSRAALAYGRIAQAPGIGPLVGLLGDSEAEVRRTAAFSLGQFGWVDARKGHEAEMVAGILPLLSEREASVRSRAIAALSKLAEPDAVTQAATPLLRDADLEVRAQAALALFRTRQMARARDPKAMPASLPEATFMTLASLGADAEVEVRRAVSYFFSRNTEPRALDLAQQFLRDSDVWVRLNAVLALRRIADPASMPALLGATADSEYTVRVAAVQALASLKQIDKIPAERQSDPVFHVRAAVADAYASSDTLGEQALEHLSSQDPSPTVKARALVALAGRRKAAAAPLLMSALDNDSQEVRAAAVSSASALGLSSAEATTLLMRGLSDRTERVRVAALEQLGEIPEAWAYQAIQTALSAPGLAERGTAAGVLGTRKEPERTALAWRAFMESAEHRWRDVRQSLLDVFAADMSSDSTEHLRTAARDPERQVAAYARELLLSRGQSDVPEPPVEIYVRSPYREQRFSKNPIVVLTTSQGDFEVECFAEDAPVHVASFIGLVREGKYDGLPWHRVVPNFVIQGGDPDGSGYGDAGYSLRAEINEHRYERGTLGMPRGESFDSGGSQLFFTHLPTPHLDGQYTVFGQIRKGTEVIDRIEQGDRILRARLAE